MFLLSFSSLLCPAFPIYALVTSILHSQSSCTSLLHFLVFFLLPLVPVTLHLSDHTFHPSPLLPFCSYFFLLPLVSVPFPFLPLLLPCPLSPPPPPLIRLSLQQPLSNSSTTPSVLLPFLLLPIQPPSSSSLPFISFPSPPRLPSFLSLCKVPKKTD